MDFIASPIVLVCIVTLLYCNTLGNEFIEVNRSMAFDGQNVTFSYKN